MTQGQATGPTGWMLLGALAACCALSGGCVYRQFTVETTPPGAILEVNGKIVGPTPADVPFVHYGTYEFTIRREGYETLTVKEYVAAPWYEWFPLEFVSEVLVPWQIQDKQRFHYDLKPQQAPSPKEVEDMLYRSGLLRQQGRSIGVPLAPAPAPVTVPPNGPPPGGFETLPVPNPK